jgi:hypothetical protein
MCPHRPLIGVWHGAILDNGAKHLNRLRKFRAQILGWPGTQMVGSLAPGGSALRAYSRLTKKPNGGRERPFVSAPGSMAPGGLGRRGIGWRRGRGPRLASTGTIPGTIPGTRRPGLAPAPSPAPRSRSWWWLRRSAWCVRAREVGERRAGGAIRTFLPRPAVAADPVARGPAPARRPVGPRPGRRPRSPRAPKIRE